MFQIWTEDIPIVKTDEEYLQGLIEIDNNPELVEWAKSKLEEIKEVLGAVR
jgi:hypothetical protein